MVMHFRIIMTAVLLMATHTWAGARGPQGTITGSVVDKATRSPLPGVNVLLVGTQRGAATDVHGEYRIANVPAGGYAVQFRFMGYQPVTKTDVIVRSNRTVAVNAGLQFQVLEMESVVITDGYFSDRTDQPVSAMNFGYEEIRRSPGAFGDVSRIMMNLPSVAPSGDMSNALVVRGGNPLENGFYVDNIAIPNINHFPTQGQTSGALGILNVEFIDDVSFYAGGFSAAYDNSLSSVVDISLREGARDGFAGSAELNFAGFGATAEGPLAKGAGSWLFSLRRSYLDMLVKNIDVGTTLAPRYGDMMGKVVYDINANHRISLVGVSSDDHNRAPFEIAEENQMIYYGNQDIVQSTVGLNWRALWSKRGFSNTSLAITQSDHKEDFFDVSTRNPLLLNRSNETTVSLRNSNEFRLGRHAFKFGVQAKNFAAHYDNFYGKCPDPLGKLVPALTIAGRESAFVLGAFGDLNIALSQRMSATLGVRGDYFSYNEDFTLSPTLSFRYKVNSLTSISAAAGLYRQNVPFILLSQSDSHRSLKNMTASHIIFGLSHLLGESTRITLELYKKHYHDVPLDPNQGALFIIDETYYSNGFYQPHDALVSKGKAESYGIEFMLQKKLADKVYGVAGGSLFRSQYTDLNGVTRNRVFDNRYIATIEGGYKPNNRWEFSLRWVLAGGVPFTPFDQEKSTNANRAIFDDGKINGERYPLYNSMNLRLDRRFHFGRSNLVVFLSVWNALNQQHVASYYWNSFENRQDTIYQWRAMPLFGVEFDF